MTDYTDNKWEQLVQELRVYCNDSTDYQDRVDLVIAGVISQRKPNADLSTEIKDAMKKEFGTEPSEGELAVLVECADLSIKSLNFDK